jgi:cysteine-rich repeat protein
MRARVRAVVLAPLLVSACIAGGGNGIGKGKNGAGDGRGGNGAGSGSYAVARDAGSLIVVGGTGPGFARTPPNCGDGKVTPDEACDDGNKMDGDGCSSNCLSVEPGYSCTPAGMPHRR